VSWSSCGYSGSDPITGVPEILGALTLPFRPVILTGILEKLHLLIIGTLFF